MGVAVSGMHYTGMAAVGVHLHSTAPGTFTGESPTSILLPMLIGPVIFLLLAGVVVMFDPMLVLGEGDWDRSAARGRRSEPEATRQPWRADRPDIPLQHPDDDAGPSLFTPRPRREAPARQTGDRAQRW
jgi:hypothetical protein